MAHQPQTHEQIPQPLQREPDELVENIYPIQDTEAPDLRSQDRMGLYLMDRFEPDPGPTTRLAFEATGRTLPGVRRVPAGPKEVTRLRATDEWAVSPRQALAVMVLSAAIFNGIGNHETVEGAAHWVGHKVERVFNPVHDTKKVVTHTTHVPGKIVDLQVNADVASTDVTGSHVSLNPQEIQSLSQKIKVLKSQGGKVLSMEVVGKTSNDWGAKGDAAFGHPNPENAQLGTRIAQSAYSDIKSELATAGLDGVTITFTQHESVLPESVAENLIAEAKAAGYDSLESAVKAVDHGELSQGQLAQDIRTDLISQRGEAIDVKVELPGKSTTHVTRDVEMVPGVDHAPHVPKPHWYWFIPMIPFKRRERYQPMKQTHRLQFVPSTEVMRPTLIREDADQAWLRVRPEAVNEDGTLVENAWAYTRKYEHLLRDDRIAEVLRADFKDPEGEDKSLRIMFVDEAPKQETVDVFTGLLNKFAAMDNGKIADRVSAIFVYPSENAGTGHDDPKRIAMGVDKQSSEDVLGTYTYILDLVELHMPTKLDPKELEALLESFDGAAWTLAHEVAGHATDDSDAKLRLRRVATSGIPNAHVVDGDPRARKMKPMRRVLGKLPRRSHGKKAPTEFDTTYSALDKNGQPVPMRAHVMEGDPRLAHATSATIVGHQPTQYSGDSDSEHYAETAAATTTGIEIPYSEAYVTVPGLATKAGQRALFAEGYRPDARGQQVFTQSVGARDGVFPVSFKNPPAVTISRTSAEEDPLLREEMIRTRRLITLTPAEMVAILARATRRGKGRA